MIEFYTQFCQSNFQRPEYSFQQYKGRREWEREARDENTLDEYILNEIL